MKKGKLLAGTHKREIERALLERARQIADRAMSQQRERSTNPLQRALEVPEELVPTIQVLLARNSKPLGR